MPPNRLARWKLTEETEVTLGAVLGLLVPRDGATLDRITELVRQAAVPALADLDLALIPDAVLDLRDAGQIEATNPDAALHNIVWRFIPPEEAP